MSKNETMFSMIPEQFFSNYINIEYDKKGYAKFIRFYPQQFDAYKDNDMYKEMSNSTSGVVLNFITSGNSIRFKSKIENKMKTLGPVIKQINIDAVLFALKNAPKASKKNKKMLLDGIDLVVDGKLILTKRIKNGTVKFDFYNPFSKKCEVKIYFPAIFETRIKDLKINGIVEKIEPKENILCLGDSITQGFIAGSPSANYAARLSAALNVNAYNQGVGGYVYNAKSLNGLEAFCAQFGLPKFITVAYGTNDWYYMIAADTLQRNIADYFMRLTKIFPITPIYVISPIWRGDSELNPLLPASTNLLRGKIPFSDVAQIIKNEAKHYPSITTIDGMNLLPHDFKYFSDVYLHPNAEGFAIMADNLLESLKNAGIKIPSAE
ncbi:MAG: hypothetical protein Ta2B_20070 [Termitinemataceae bacterium]|nr:MAG: hypothetical protein Ta2B_20070 [Termitinemataceae bacterium]